MSSKRPAARRRSAFASFTKVVLASLAVWLASLAALPANATDPNRAHPTHLVTATRDGYSISGIANHLEGATRFRYGIALFAGNPGILQAREENGTIRHTLGGNFLIRSRRHWLDDDVLVLSVDAPSDHWNSFPQSFRASERYGRDVAELLREAGRRFGIDDWTLVGTSEGSVSAFHAARMNPTLAKRVILTASLFRPNRNGGGLSDADFTRLEMPLLWVHHADDPCQVTLYADALVFARRSSAPLVTVRGGGPGQGPACQAQTAHGFVGIEQPTVLAMRQWIRTGKVPQDVGP